MTALAHQAKDKSVNHRKKEEKRKKINTKNSKINYRIKYRK
jgi:hypothetical protein